MVLTGGEHSQPRRLVLSLARLGQPSELLRQLVRRHPDQQRVGADPGMVAGEVRGPPRQLCLVDQLHGQRRGVQVQRFPSVFLQVVGDFLPGVVEADPRPHGRGKVNDVVYECLDVASHGGGVQSRDADGGQRAGYGRVVPVAFGWGR